MTIKETNVYTEWVEGLRDPRAIAHIERRVRRLASGNPGDVKPVGEGVSELRIHYGPGYRVYFKQFGNVVVVLLIGGDKSTQRHDIEFAKGIANELEKGNSK